MATYSAAQIANYFIRRSLEENKPISPMKLQKLVYYAYGWYWAFKNDKLFDEPILAWKYGPVIDSLYHKLKFYGNGNITEPVSTLDVTRLHINYPEIVPEDWQFLGMIWTSFYPYDAIQLSSSTHAEGSPWDLTAKKYGGYMPPGVTIDDGLIKDYFNRMKTKMEQSKAQPQQ